jgi:hypothetical protein
MFLEDWITQSPKKNAKLPYERVFHFLNMLNPWSRTLYCTYKTFNKKTDKCFDCYEVIFLCSFIRYLRIVLVKFRIIKLSTLNISSEN